MTLRIVLSLMLVMSGCRGGKTVTGNPSDFIPDFNSGPPTLVYKTAKDYSNLVPVLLSEDKSQIISYPHPSDLKSEKGFPLPTVLEKGYLLDNRGINRHVAFLKLTYQEYAGMKSVDVSQLYGLIFDKDPLIELCDCGSRHAFSDLEKQLNNIITDDKLKVVCKDVRLTTR